MRFRLCIMTPGSELYNVNITLGGIDPPQDYFEKHLLDVESIRADISEDCKVNLLDFLIIASERLLSNDPAL